MKHTKGLPVVTFLKLATREELMESFLNIYNEHTEMYRLLKGLIDEYPQLTDEDVNDIELLLNEIEK